MNSPKQKNSELVPTDEIHDKDRVVRWYKVGYSALQDIIDEPSSYFPGFGEARKHTVNAQGRYIRLTGPRTFDDHEYITTYTMHRPTLIRRAIGRITGREPQVEIEERLPLRDIGTSQAWGKHGES